MGISWHATYFQILIHTKIMQIGNVFWRTKKWSRNSVVQFDIFRTERFCHEAAHCWNNIEIRYAFWFLEVSKMLLFLIHFFRNVFCRNLKLRIGYFVSCALYGWCILNLKVIIYTKHEPNIRTLPPCCTKSSLFSLTQT